MNRQCLLDESSKVALSLKCPSCQSALISTPPSPSATNSPTSGRPQSPQILTRYTNEGGVQDNLDILPLIIEEAYLEANPSARPARALMHMCSQGDVGGIFELLQTVDEDHEDGEQNSMSPADLLRYQDPLDGMKSALHLAVESGKQEIVWLLLWLASDLPDAKFPEEAIHVAESVHVSRQSTAGSVDIRSLRNAQGQTARTVANAIGESWVSLLQSGIL
jgi:hypothetical protein